jgi:hypothetical protein
MREYDECDPRRIVATAMAANDLTSRGERAAHPGDLIAVQMQIFLLRAGANGWRELHWDCKADYVGRIARDAAHDAGLCAKYARDCDRAANKLCAKIGLPFEYQGQHECLALQFWTHYRAVYAEIQDGKLCWLLIALAFSRIAMNRAEWAACEVSTGGTAEAREVWNARARKARPAVAVAVASRDEIAQMVSARAAEIGLCPQFDCELMDHVESAGLRFCDALRAYEAAQRK